MFTIAPAFISFVVFLSPIAPNVDGLRIECVPIMITGQYAPPRMYVLSSFGRAWQEADSTQYQTYRYAVQQCSTELGIPAPLPN